MNFIKSNSIIIGFLCFLGAFSLRYLETPNQSFALALVFLIVGLVHIWRFAQRKKSVSTAYPMVVSLLILFSLANLFGFITLALIPTALSYILISGVLFTFSQ